MSRVRVYVQPGFFLTAAAGILLIPFRWLASWMIAAMVHEVFHLMAILICGLSVRYVTIGAFGAVISADIEPGRKMAVCALAGPIGGLLLVVFIRFIPRISLCALLQSMYNLLPIYPLDGGQVLAGLLTPVFSPKVMKIILSVTESVVIAVLTLAALCACFVLRLGTLPVIFAAALILKNKKIPCKRRPLRVQYR